MSYLECSYGETTAPSSQPRQGKVATGQTKKGGKKASPTRTQVPQEPTAGPSWREATAPGTEDATPWTKVLGRKGGKRKGVATPNQPRPQEAVPKRKAPAPKDRAVKIVAPRTAAIVLSLKEGATNFIEVLAKAKASISLADFGLSAIKIRPTMTGARMMEVGGERPEQTAFWRKDCGRW